MILLAMVFLSLSEQCATGGHGKNARCQRGVISRLPCGGHHFCAARPALSHGLRDIADPPRRAVAFALRALQLHIETKILPLETACMPAALGPAPAARVLTITKQRLAGRV
jgi:hypothetical protein